MTWLQAIARRSQAHAAQLLGWGNLICCQFEGFGKSNVSNSHAVQSRTTADTVSSFQMAQLSLAGGLQLLSRREKMKI